MANTEIDLDFLAGLTAAGKAIMEAASADAQLTALGLTANGQSLVKSADYAAMRTLLGVLADTDKTSWTPALSFVTPGNLSVAYSTQAGRYVRMGNLVISMFSLITSTFTHTTASGAFEIGGLPATVTSSEGGITGSGFLQWQGITKANYTGMVMQPVAGTTTMRIIASGSGQNVATIQASDMPTGGTVRLIGTAAYLT